MVRLASIFSLPVVALSCDGTCDGANNCYHSQWAVPCSQAADQSACEASSGCWTPGAGPSPAPTPGPAPPPKSGGMMGAYFANWAQYHAAPYTHKAEDLAPIASKTDHVYFGFLYFCPPAGTSPMPYWASAPYGSCSDDNEYSLMTLETNDPQSISTLVSQGPKVIASIGGWNFPSSYFSKMVASSESRQKFITGAKSFLTQHGFAGIDIDWEFPCSEPRNDPVKITCEKFRQVEDAGGNCPADTQNLVQFLKELRAGLGDDMYISVASQAAEKHWTQMDIKASSQYVDHFNVMNYDYTVSDIEDGATMSPNAPLYNPSSASGALQMSIDYTITGYLKAGVPKEKIMVGIPFYGHTWYQPGMSDWQKFGGQGSVQGQCCGPFKSTYGGKPGQGCSQCGVMMYSEILAAGCETQYDDETKSDIAYCSSAGKDGYTEAGTWITYNGKKSIHEITAYAMEKGLAGVFVFDTSMDSIAGTNGESFELMNQIADDLAGGSPAPSPSPTPSPTPSPSPSPASTYKCVSGQCVAAAGGIDKATCDAVCEGPSTYKCVSGQCVADAGGIAKDTCEAICGGFSFV